MENTPQNFEVQTTIEPPKKIKKKFSILRVLLTLVIIFAFLITITFVIGFYHKLTYKENNFNAKKCRAGKCQYCDIAMCQQIEQADSCKVAWVPFACGPSCDSYKEQCIDKSIDY